MSSTYVDFRNRGFEVSDGALEVWLALLVREIDALSESPAWLHEVRQDWNIQATAAFGFGVMPGLDERITSDEKRDTILTLSWRALEKLEKLGPVFSADQLNRLGVGSSFTASVDAKVFLRTARYFIKLLEETLEPGESDARFGNGVD